MNILFDIRSLSDKNITGVGFYTLHLLDNLLKIDKENQYFLFINHLRGISPLLREKLLKWKKENNVKILTLNYPSKFLNFLLKFKFIKLDEFLSKRAAVSFDLYVASNINYLNLSETIKYVLTVHDLSFVYFPEFFNLKQRLWHRFVNYKKLYQRADHIFAVSDNTKLDLLDLGIDAKKVQTMPLAVDYKSFANLDLHHPNFQHLREKYKLPARFVLFMGTLEPRKNLELLLEAYRLLRSERPDLKLLLAGQSTAHSRKLLKSYQDLADSVFLLNYIDEADKKYLYALADLLVYPSFYEGFGLPPLEAMAAGCSVIVGRNSALLENFAQYLPTTDVHSAAELKELICYTIDNKKFYQEKISKINWDDFSWENYAKKYLEKLCALV